MRNIIEVSMNYSRASVHQITTFSEETQAVCLEITKCSSVAENLLCIFDSMGLIIASQKNL